MVSNLDISTKSKKGKKMQKDSKLLKRPEKNYMCVNPYEGFVCKRNGNHAGVAMPNFRTCYAIIIITSNSLLALHYPSGVYSKKLPENFKKWQAVFEEKIEQTLIVLNGNYADFHQESSIENFRDQLNKDIGLKFNVIKIVGLKPSDDLLIVDVAAGTVNLCNNDIMIHPKNYGNWPRNLFSRLRYYTCRAQFYTKNDDFQVMIMGSKNFLSPIEEKLWPTIVNDHVKLLRQKKPAALQTIGQDLIKASLDKNNEKYPWTMAIGLLDKDLPNNLKHYLYLVLGLMHFIDKTVDLESLKKQVECIDQTLGLRFIGKPVSNNNLPGSHLTLAR